MRTFENQLKERLFAAVGRDVLELGPKQVMQNGPDVFVFQVAARVAPFIEATGELVSQDVINAT